MAEPDKGVNAEDFDYVCGLVRQHSGIVLEPGKEYLVEARLAPLARQEGFASIADLAAQLRRLPFSRLHTQVVSALATNETSFFRDSIPFESLRLVVIPELMKARAATRRINIWSAACSSGQEAYSVAMLVREHFPTLAGWDVNIIATDLSEDMIARGRSGSYSQLEINRGLPAPMLVKYFVRDGTGWRIKDDVRSMVEFRRLNLAEPWSMAEDMDVVLLRNVLIYFDLDTRKMILKRVRTVLKTDGYLVLGGGESPVNLDDNYKRIQCEKCDFYQIV